MCISLNNFKTSISNFSDYSVQSKTVIKNTTTLVTLPLTLLLLIIMVFKIKTGFIVATLNTIAPIFLWVQLITLVTILLYSISSTNKINRTMNIYSNVNTISFTYLYITTYLGIYTFTSMQCIMLSLLVCLVFGLIDLSKICTKHLINKIGV